MIEKCCGKEVNDLPNGGQMKSFPSYYMNTCGLDYMLWKDSILIIMVFSFLKNNPI